MTTIYALSSGSIPSGIAVVRVSGGQCKAIAKKMIKKVSETQVSETQSRAQVYHSDIVHPENGKLLDKAIVLWFPAPNSFTGEDVIEIHCHGGIATVQSVLEALRLCPDTKMAEAGEFSRRAFENGKLDLTQLEGLADVMAAQTENQRQQAMNQASGKLREIYEKWRSELIRIRALVEASLDFNEEEDVKQTCNRDEVVKLKNEIEKHLEESEGSEKIREGFRIVLAGKPNAGKSSVLNALAKRDVAIVTPQAGTTRDVVEVNLNINAHLAIVSDTAGIRKSEDVIEQEGVRRAVEAAQNADMTLWLHALDDDETPKPSEGAILIFSKADLGKKNNDNRGSNIFVSVKEKDGLSQLTQWLKEQLDQKIRVSESPVLTRQRHRDLLGETLEHLNRVFENDKIEMQAEELRLASECIGRLTGRIDVEELLEVIFSEFCIGK